MPTGIPRTPVISLYEHQNSTYLFAEFRLLIKIFYLLKCLVNSGFVTECDVGEQNLD